MDRTGNIFRKGRTCRHGFTLMETALATVIIGVGIMAMMRLVNACTTENDLAKQTTTAMLLADHIQEAMAGLAFNDPIAINPVFGPEPGETLATYNDVDDFDGASYSPPINSMRNAMPQFIQFTQVISVCPVLPAQLNGNTDPAHPTIAKTTYTGAVRVTVQIMYRRVPTDPPTEVYRTNWIRTDR
jgi:prepilin-type N-terminal cleavage/methylation domain-containing protein